MGYKIESEYKLESDWMPSSEFTRVHTSIASAVATAIEGMFDPDIEVKVVDEHSGEVVWNSLDEEY